MTENGKLMLHAAVTGVFGNVADLFSAEVSLKSWDSWWGSIIAARTGQAESTVLQWLTGPDRWFDANEALSLGLVDEICIRGKTATSDGNNIGGGFP